MRRILVWIIMLGFLAACGGPTQGATSEPQTPAPTQAAADPTAEPEAVVEPTVPFATPIPLPTQQPTPPPPADLKAEFSGENALRLAEIQMQWVPRYPGTAGWQATGDWIVSTLTGFGWTVEERYFSTPDGGEGRNIIATRGAGPLVLIGGHYDTRKFADEDPDPARRSEPVPGAHDGASGVAVLLELARVLQPEQLDKQVMLAFFDAEDNGELENWDWILGSRDFARNLVQRPQQVVIVDMVGDSDQQLYYEQTSNPELREEIWDLANELGYTTFIKEEKHALIDDHTPFLEQGIPAIDIIDFDYPYWHTTADTLDKLSAESLEAVGRTLEVWLTQP